jgi:hypothetical protein
MNPMSLGLRPQTQIRRSDPARGHYHRWRYTVHMQYTFKVIQVPAAADFDSVEELLNMLGGEGYRPFPGFGSSCIIMGKEVAEVFPGTARIGPHIEYGDTIKPRRS